MQQPLQNPRSLYFDTPQANEDEPISEELRDVCHIKTADQLVASNIFKLVHHFYGEALQGELQTFLETEYELSDGKVLFGIDGLSRYAQIAVTKGCSIKTYTVAFSVFEFDDFKYTVTIYGGQTIKMEFKEKDFYEVVFGLSLMDEYLNRVTADGSNRL